MKMTIVEFWNGGYDEKEVATFDNVEAVREYIEKNDCFLGSNYGEEGYSIRMEDGTEVWDEKKIPGWVGWSWEQKYKK